VAVYPYGCKTFPQSNYAIQYSCVNNDIMQCNAATNVTTCDKCTPIVYKPSTCTANGRGSCTMPSLAAYPNVLVGITYAGENCQPVNEVIRQYTVYSTPCTLRNANCSNFPGSSSILTCMGNEPPLPASSDKPNGAAPTQKISLTIIVLLLLFSIL